MRGGAADCVDVVPARLGPFKTSHFYKTPSPLVLHHPLLPNPLPRLRRLCLALPGAWEKVSHGEPTFWVGRKMFATFADAANHHGAGRHAVWCKATHVTQDLLLTRAPDRYFRPPYVGQSGWIGIYLDRAPDWKAVAERLAHAHELAAPRSTRRRS